MAVYKGFSSYEYQRSKTFSIRDMELVKLDLLNHIFTRKGERIHMPTFGTRIPDMAFEPLDDMTMMIVEEDLKQVVSFDPRVRLVNLRIIPDYDKNAVTAEVDLLYVELNRTDKLELNIMFGE